MVSVLPWITLTRRPAKLSAPWACMVSAITAYAPDPLTAHYRSAGAHNTILIDGKGVDGGVQLQPVLPLVDRRATVEHQHGIALQPLKHTSRRHRHEGLVGNDHQVRIADNAAFEDGAFCGADIGKDRCAAPFSTVARGILDFVAFLEERSAEDTAGGFHALATTPMEADSEH